MNHIICKNGYLDTDRVVRVGDHCSGFMDVNDLFLGSLQAKDVPRLKVTTPVSWSSPLIFSGLDNS